MNDDASLSSEVFFNQASQVARSEFIDDGRYDYDPDEDDDDGDGLAATELADAESSMAAMLTNALEESCADFVKEKTTFVQDSGYVGHLIKTRDFQATSAASTVFRNIAAVQINKPVAELMVAGRLAENILECAERVSKEMDARAFCSILRNERDKWPEAIGETHKLVASAFMNDALSAQFKSVMGTAVADLRRAITSLFKAEEMLDACCETFVKHTPPDHATSILFAKTLAAPPRQTCVITHLPSAGQETSGGASSTGAYLEDYCPVCLNMVSDQPMVYVGMCTHAHCCLACFKADNGSHKPTLECPHPLPSAAMIRCNVCRSGGVYQSVSQIRLQTRIAVVPLGEVTDHLRSLAQAPPPPKKRGAPAVSETPDPAKSSATPLNPKRTRRT